MAQGDDVIPLPGSKTLKYAEENILAAHVKLSAEELKSIRGLVEDIERDLGKDARGPEFLLQMSWVDTPLP